MPIVGRDHKGREVNLEPLPWEFIEPHRRQAYRNHEQSLEQLRSRGGLGPSEAVAILEDRPWTKMTQHDALLRLAELVKAGPPAPRPPASREDCE
jgi:hypothetical protein